MNTRVYKLSVYIRFIFILNIVKSILHFQKQFDFQEIVNLSEKIQFQNKM